MNLQTKTPAGNIERERFHERYPDIFAASEAEHWHIASMKEIQEAQPMLTNPRDAFSQGHHSTIPYVTYSFLLCTTFDGICGVPAPAVVISSLKRAVFPIFHFKNVRTLKSGQRLLKVIESGAIR